jgi:hypothetical protein
LRKGPDRLGEGFQRVFPTNDIAEEDGQKIDDFLPSKAAARKTHLFNDLDQNTLPAKMLDEHRRLAKPRGERGDRL